jgi:hypothetical protein
MRKMRIAKSAKTAPEMRSDSRCGWNSSAVMRRLRQQPVQFLPRQRSANERKMTHRKKAAQARACVA